MSVNISNTGLYSGNVIIEYNTDQKVVKPVIKVNEKATKDEVDNAIFWAGYALVQASRELDNYDFIVPEPVKHSLSAQIENVREGEKEGPRYDGGIYKDNEEVLNMKDAGTESHTQ